MNLPNPVKTSLPPLVALQGITKSFGKQEVLKGVDLQLQTGKITAILGPNGSGKTTLIKSILGLVRPQAGQIMFQQEAILGKWDYRKDIAYLPQIARFPENLQVSELMHLVQDLRQEQGNPEELITLFGLEPYMNARLRHLSGGTRQKVNVVCALMFDAPLLILDEPTVGLDPVATLSFKDLVVTRQEAGKTVLFTTHIMSLVEEMAEEIIFLLEGKICFQGSVTHMKERFGEEQLERAIAKLLEENPHA